MSLEAYVRAAALATPALTALLGTNPFRWYDSTLLKGDVFPAVVARLTSDSPTYTIATGANAVGSARMQFTIWGDTSASAHAVDAAIECFLVTFNAMGVSTLSANPNYILNRTARIYQETNQIKYQRIIDVKIFSNQLVTA